MASSSTVQPARLSPPLDARLAPPIRGREPIARARLLQRLRSVPEAGVVLLQAPAGYGKSTLLGQLAAADARRLVWLTLEGGGGDAGTFIADLAFAFGRHEQLDADLLDRLSAGAAGVVPLALPRLVRHVSEAQDPLLLVLDDVHHLTDPVALNVLRALIDHLGPASTLVLSGRSRPDIGVGRLRAEGRLVEVTASDLRMTAGEGTALLRAAGADVDDEEGRLAVGRTEGWAAALYLTAIVLRDGEPAEDDQLGPRQDDLDDYFRDEVLAGAAQEDADFLLRTAILDELEPAACDAVLERSDSAQRLRALAGEDLFVAPLGRSSGVYQVHGLFRENLLHELRRSSPGLERELHGRASRWFAGRGEPEQAIRHALAGGDVQSAADLVFARLFEYEVSGREPLLRRWCAWFTDEQQHAHPELAITLGWCALDGGDGAGAAHWAAVALGGPTDRVLVDGTDLGAHAHLLDAAVGAGGVTQAAHAAAIADARFPADVPYRSVSQLVLGGTALMRGDRDEAIARLRDAERRSASLAPAPYTLSLAQLAVLALEEGRDDEAGALLARARDFQRVSGLGEYATQALVASVRALQLARAGDVAPAREEAARAARALTLNRYATPWITAQARLVLAQAAVELRELASARTLLGEARRVAERDPDAVWLHAAVAEVAAQVDEVAGAGGGDDPLTIAELRTLQYLPTHLSLREVGDRLYVSRNTVKTHTISIYRKLGVNSRSEAVARGRELGLLEA